LKRKERRAEREEDFSRRPRQNDEERGEGNGENPVKLLHNNGNNNINIKYYNNIIY